MQGLEIRPALGRPIPLYRRESDPFRRIRTLYVMNSTVDLKLICDGCHCKSVISQIVLIYNHVLIYFHSTIVSFVTVTNADD